MVVLLALAWIFSDAKRRVNWRLVAGGLLVGGAQNARAEDHGGNKPPGQKWSFSGPFGKFDRGALQRGLRVYKEVCSACHGLSYVAFRNLAGFTAGTSFRAWLRAIAANLIRAEVQRYAREQQNQFNYARARELERSLMTGPGAGESAEVEHLRECLASLPPHMQELVELKYAQDQPIETIAAKLARTENAVWQALFRLRAQLKQCVEEKIGRAM
jgi:RNA polymerase sigma factor (sigma-70 family)